MKRDMDLVRKILLFKESEDVKEWGKIKNEYSAEQIGYHCHLIIEAGLAEGIDDTDLGSNHKTALLTELTWDGHDFLDDARLEKNWAKAKKVCEKAGSFSLEVMKSVLTKIIIQAASNTLN